jgi:hypothetical protein
MNQPLIHHTHSLSVFRDIFFRIHKTISGSEQPTNPTVRLDDVVHWKVHMDAIQCQHLAVNSVHTRICGGYFYNFTSPPLAADALDLLKIESTQFDLTLIPTTEENPELDALYEGYGFIKIPCFVNCTFEVETSIKEDLRKRTSRSRVESIRRLHRRSNEGFELRFYRSQDLIGNHNLIRTAAGLHNLNIMKYDLPINFYDEEVISKLATSALAKFFLIGLRFSRSTGNAVQVMIILEDPNSNLLYYLVQGIDQDQIPKGQNLYIASVYDLLLYAESKGYTQIHLGRGNQEKKAALGANRFTFLNHWALTSHQNLKEELKQIARRSQDILFPKS